MKHRSEDVEQVVEVLLHEDYRDGVADPVTFAQRVLDAVAPSLMALALRRHADRLDDYDAHDDIMLHVRHVVRDMRTRADEIEAQP